MTNIEKLKDIKDAQSRNGNWNYDAYMHGMANGLILAVSVMQDGGDNEPKFLKAPDKWIADIRINSQHGANTLLKSRRDSETERCCGDCGFLITECECN